MIDETTVEQWMREANPIPTLDDVDADEFAAFVATAHTRRAAVMQAPTQHPTPASPATSPPPRRRKAWAFAAAFVLVLLVVGVAAWLVPGEEAPVADEPVTPTAVTSPEVATTAAEEPELTAPQLPGNLTETPRTTFATEPELTAPTGPDAAVVANRWQQVATPSKQPWVRGIGQIEPLPGGGYVAVGWTPSERSWVPSIDQIDPLPGGGYVGGEDELDLPFVMWSPNGIDWFDGDPQRLIEDVADFAWPARYLAVVGEQVVILHHIPDKQIAVSIGDPRDGTWRRIGLDASGIYRELGGVRLAANDDEVLVAAYADPAPNGEGQPAVSTQLMVWIVDAAEDTATRNSFPVSATDAATPLVEWVDERWIVIALEDADGPDRYAQRNALWTSTDGRAWSQVTMAEGMDGVHSVRAGPSGVAAATCGMGSLAAEPPEDGFWYSSDGLDWSLVAHAVELGLHGNPVIASWGDRGFVVQIGLESDSGVVLVASDGSEMVVMPSPFGGAWAAAASGDTLLAASGGGLWLYQEPAND